MSFNGIVVSVLMDKDKEINLSRRALLYESRIVTNDEIKRVVYLLPVKELLPFTRQALSDGITIEHIFDY